MKFNSSFPFTLINQTQFDMKTKLYLLVFTFFALQSASAQAVFGVTPGIGLHNAYLGIKFNNLVPFVSLQYLNADYEYAEEDYTEDFSGSLLIPTLGAKWFIGGQNSIKSYLQLAVSKPIVSGKLEYDGEEDPDFGDAINNLSLFGAELGFGVEYFFDDHFSIGGEYGLRMVTGKFEVDDEFDAYTVKAAIRPTYSKVSFNYYFGSSQE